MAALAHTSVAKRGSPTVLYLHGFMGCADDWRETIARLGDHFSRLAVDLPGHGRTTEELSAEDHSMPGCARLIVSLLDSLRIDKCHLVGYSMGGRLGLYLLAHHPDRFDRAVIESASPGLRTEAERRARREADRELQQRLRTVSLEQFVDDWYRLPLFDTIDRSGAGYRYLRERRLQNRPEGLALSLEHMGTGAQPSLWDRLSEVRHRILFVAGEKDDKFRSLAEEMTNLCPNGQAAIIPSAGHNTHFERPVEFCNDVAQFLAAKD